MLITTKSFTARKGRGEHLRRYQRVVRKHRPVRPVSPQSHKFLAAQSVPLITSDYVIDEALTLLRARGELTKSIALGRQLLDLQIANVTFVNPELFTRAWELFRDQPTRRWSFTDCTSKIIMDELHIRNALSLDQHFIDFGAIDVLK